MNYISTRGGAQPVGSAQALLESLAPDGGLWVPETLPYYNDQRLLDLANQPFSQRMAQILGDLLPELDQDGLIRACQTHCETYDAPQLGGRLQSLNPYVKKAYMIELWRNPTGGFEQLTLDLATELIDLAQNVTGETRPCRPVVVARQQAGAALCTTAKQQQGDHRKALVFYPAQPEDPIKQLQLETCINPQHQQVFEVKAHADELIEHLRTALTHCPIPPEEDQAAERLVLLQSTAWARLAPLIAFMMAAWVEVFKTEDFAQEETVHLAMPIENASLLFASWVIRQMGAACSKMIVSTNRNKIAASLLGEGTIEAKTTRQATLIPAMDIEWPLNLERLLFEVTGHDAETVKACLAARQKGEPYTLDAVTQRRLRANFIVSVVDDRVAQRQLAQVYDETDHLIDGQLASTFYAVQTYLKKSADPHKVLYLAPSSPYLTPGFNLQAVCGKAALKPLKAQAPQALIEVLRKESGLPLPESLAGLDSLEPLSLPRLRLDEIDNLLFQFSQGQASAPESSSQAEWQEAVAQQQRRREAQLEQAAEADAAGQKEAPEGEAS